MGKGCCMVHVKALGLLSSISFVAVDIVRFWCMQFLLPREAVAPIRVKLFFCDIWKASIYLPSGVTPGSGRRGFINLIISCHDVTLALIICAQPPPLKLTKCILFKLCNDLQSLVCLILPHHSELPYLLASPIWKKATMPKTGTQDNRFCCLPQILSRLLQPQPGADEASGGSNCSWSLWCVTEVMVSYFVKYTCRVMTLLILVLCTSVLLEMKEQFTFILESCLSNLILVC
jgi:hypothetical protein